MSVSIGTTRHGITAHCLDCHHGTKLDLPALIERYGADARPLTLPLKCSRCGSKRFAVTIYPLDGPEGTVAKAPG